MYIIVELSVIMYVTRVLVTFDVCVCGGGGGGAF